ncbi:hypothetical protein RDABS01_005290 [Bienertia sinuspersici]
MPPDPHFSPLFSGGCGGGETVYTMDSMHKFPLTLVFFSMRNLLKHNEHSIARYSWTSSRDNVPTTIYARWLQPPFDWWALNTDGAARGAPGRAGGGGSSEVIRGQAKGSWYGYGIRSQVRFSKDNYPNGQLSCVSTLKNETPPHGACVHLINHCRDLLCSQDWDATLVHVYREGNKAADQFANAGADSQEKINPIEGASPWKKVEDRMIEGLDGFNEEWIKEGEDVAATSEESK